MLQKQMLFGLEICNIGLALGNTGEKTQIHLPQIDKIKKKHPEIISK